MKYLFVWILFISGIIVPSCIIAQRNPDTTRTFKRVEILFAEKETYLKSDSNKSYITYVGNVQMKQDNTLFFADSLILTQQENLVEAFGNVRINDADTIQVSAQYLKYLGKEKRAFLQKKVVLKDGKGILTTDDLEYDTQLKIGIYRKGGRVVNKKTTLVSQEGFYYGETKDVIFKKQVVFTDPEKTIRADTLQYNTAAEMVTLLSPTIIKEGKRTIRATDGLYDLKQKKGFFNKRPFIDDSTYTFTANEMAFDDSTGLSEFKGNAVYRSKDSANGVDLIANHIKTNNKTNSFLATQKPLLLIKQKRDSVFITADTLFSTRLSLFQKERKVPFVRDSSFYGKSLPDSTDKMFEAFRNVRIFTDSMQAVGDSLFYSLEDSVFRLFKEPVLWAQQNQVTGDTIYLFMKDGKPEQLRVFENAASIQFVEKDYYNQISGNSIYGYFTKGRIQVLRAKGSAETIYYAVDEEKKYAGVNQATSDVVEIWFDPEADDNTPQEVKLLFEVKGSLLPMNSTDHSILRIRKFKWLEEKRPKSKFDILSL